MEEKEDSLPGSNTPDYLSRAITYFHDKSFNEALGEHVQKHAHIFNKASEAKSSEHVEHSLGMNEVHEAYLQIFENLMSEFLVHENCSQELFYSQCNDALNDKYTPLFEEHQHHWFVDALLSSLDYGHFFDMMCNEARKSDYNSPSNHK